MISPKRKQALLKSNLSAIRLMHNDRKGVGYSAPFFIIGMPDGLKNL
jgi:hypothetical protein